MAWWGANWRDYSPSPAARPERRSSGYGDTLLAAQWDAATRHTRCIRNRHQLIRLRGWHDTCASMRPRVLASSLAESAIGLTAFYGTRPPTESRRAGPTAGCPRLSAPEEALEVLLYGARAH